MRVLLYRLGEGEELARGALAGLVGKPVHAAPGSARVVGRILRVELVEREVYATLELDAAFLPHELTPPQVSIARVKQVESPVANENGGANGGD